MSGCRRLYSIISSVEQGSGDNVHPDGLALKLGNFHKLIGDTVESFENDPQLFVKIIPAAAQSDTSALADKKLDPKLVFEPADRLCKGGLGDVKLFRRLCDVAAFRCGIEIF